MRQERKAEIKAAIIKELKSLIGPLVVLVIILAAVATIILMPDKAVEEEIIQMRGYDGEKQEFVMENDKFLFSLDSETTQFTVTVKETGEVWTSNPAEEGIAADTIASTPAKKNDLRSTLMLTYGNRNGVNTTYCSYGYSVTNKLYEIEQGDDYIKIDYTIGDVQREFIIPPVMSQEDYETYKGILTGGSRNLLSQYYKKLDINNLSKSDEKEKDALLERYPSMADGIIYVIRDSATAAIKTKLEQIFAGVDYTYEQYLLDKELDTAEQTSNKPVYNLTVIYRLDDTGFSVEVPAESIEGKKDYPVYNLCLLPYFGAGTTTDEGFMLVPSGGGALINFNNGKLAQNSYYAEVYGWDMAKVRTALVHETRTNFNAFGLSKGNSSYVCVIENGAPYSAIQADVSGRFNLYNYVNSTYNVTKREMYEVTKRNNGDIYVYEPQLPEGEIYKQKYLLVSSGDYVDMAQAYKQYLTSMYSMDKNNTAEAPAVVEIVGAVDKIKQVLGVPVSKPLALTTFNEAAELIGEMKNAGMDNLSVKVTGWANDGVRQTIFNKVKAVRELGGNKALTNMVASAKDQGVTVYLDGITNYAIDSDLMEGFFVFTDAARQVSKEKAEIFTYNSITFGTREDLASYYLLKNSLRYEMADNFVEKLNALGAGASFQDMGKDVSSDFNRKDPVSRQKERELQSAYLAKVSEGTNVMINAGNEYAVAYADIVTNMDLGGHEYTIIDKQVPFYQMAIHGFVDYTGESLNLTANPEDELLKSAEYGAGLAFTVMEENPFTLQNTLYTQYFGSEYVSCKDEMYETYNRFNNELGHVFSQEMTDHEFLTNEVACTTYEDGTKVYVNYGYNDFTAVDGTVVPARDYSVTR